MSKTQKKISPKIKYYLTFLIICLLSLILVLNVNYINNKRKKEKLYKEKSDFFENIISNRGLDEKEEKQTQICNKISDNLKKYYKTGDKSIFGIDDDNISGKKGEHIQALINILNINFQKDDINKNEEKSANNNLLSNLIIYGKNDIPLVVILGIAILSLPGWLFCCCSCCGNCCCCCCCKKPGCKVPSFVFSYIFYGISALICFYGFGKFNSVFLNIADTECSLIKFVDEVLNGETKENTPYWPGISNITKVLNNLSRKVNELKEEDPALNVDLLNKKTIAYDAEGAFEEDLKSSGEKINEECPVGASDCKDYFVKYTFDSITKTYQLDLANKFGTINDDGEASPDDSISFLWKKEYDSDAINSRQNFEDTYTSFNIILNDADNTVSTSFDGSIQSMSGIKTSFNNIKEKLLGKIIKYGDDLDTYGRFTFQLLFTLLILMDAGIAAFLLLLCFCSGKLCNCCCCARCFCKFFIHILWNCLALFMCALFLIGSIFILFSKVGEDMMSVISFLVSEENLDANNNDAIIFGDVKQYLNKCFNGNGNILDELGFMETMDNFQNLKHAELEFEEIENQFKDNQQKFVYKEYLSELNNKITFNSNDLSLIGINIEETINFVDLLGSANELNSYERWDIQAPQTQECEDSPSEVITYHPNKCYPYEKVSDPDLKQKFKDFNDLLDLANNNSLEKGIRKILGTLESLYIDFLNSEIISIQYFKRKIQLLTSLVKEYNGESEEIFSFLNCKFIKDNTQVLLATLKTGISNDLYSVGVYLLMAAFSLAFGISFTILLIVLLNIDIDNNSNKNKNVTTNGDDVPEFPMNSEGRVLKIKQ